MFFSFLILLALIVTVALTIALWRIPAGRATAALVAAVGTFVMLPVLFFGGIIGWMTLTACRGEQRATYEEFAQYSPRQPRDLEPRPGFGYVFALGGNCHTVFNTADSSEEVAGYYTENLRRRGWEVEIEPRAPSETTEARHLETTESGGIYSRTTISATRGPYFYQVGVYSESSIEAPPGKVHVTVTVRE